MLTSKPESTKQTSSENLARAPKNTAENTTKTAASNSKDSANNALQSSNNTGKASPARKNQFVPIESINVKLNNRFGLTPRFYVSFLWASALVLFLFSLFFLPGLIRNGTWITLNTLPGDAQIIANNVRMGPSGQPFFVKRGMTQIVAQKPGFEDAVQNMDIQGRVFASLLFPRRMELSWKLAGTEDYGHLAHALKDFETWTAAGDARERYAVPPVLPWGAADSWVAKQSYKSQKEIKNGDDQDAGNSSALENALLASALPLARNERDLADIMRATYILSSDNAPVGLNGIVAMLDGAVLELLETPGVGKGLARSLGNENLREWGLDTWLQDEAGSYDESTAGIRMELEKALDEYAQIRQRENFPVQRFGSLSFVSIPAVRATVGDMEVMTQGFPPRSGSEPVTVSLNKFSMSVLEINQKEYSKFLVDQSEWAAENLEALEDLVDDFYLYDWRESGEPAGVAPAPNSPVVNVAWNAGKAYADWFTEKYLEGTGLVARLPTEYEWEVAARLNGAIANMGKLPAGLKDVGATDSGFLGLRGMSGNVREWCSDYYWPFANRFAGLGAGNVGETRQIGDGNGGGKTFALSRHVVRGGAHIDGSLAYPASIRGGLHGDVASPVLGFRIVVVDE